MKIKLTIAALIGLVIGSLVGGMGSAYFATSTMSSILVGAWRDNANNVLTDTTIYLHWLDEGKTDALKQALLSRLNASTLVLAAREKHSVYDSAPLKKQIELVNQIKSVQEDQSEIGKMAADARKRILAAD
ncbi:MAG: hypothetical protein ABIW82_09995 [Dokdonella sp.]